MPQYLFENSETGEVREIVLGMNDPKVYNGDSDAEKGIWKRIFTIPQATIGSNLDPFDKNAFANSKYTTLGDMFDKSAELSERRAAIMDGVDPVKQKALDNYAAKRHGKRHPEELKIATKKATEEAGKALGKLGLKFNLPQQKSRRLKGF